MPIITKTLSRYRAYLAAAADVLMRGRGLRGGAAKRVRAAVGHTLAFTTWQSLAREQRLSDSEAADLMCHLVAAARVSLVPKELGYASISVRHQSHTLTTPRWNVGTEGLHRRGPIVSGGPSGALPLRPQGSSRYDCAHRTRPARAL